MTTLRPHNLRCSSSSPVDMLNSFDGGTFVGPVCDDCLTGLICWTAATAADATVCIANSVKAFTSSVCCVADVAGIPNSFWNCCLAHFFSSLEASSVHDRHQEFLSLCLWLLIYVVRTKFSACFFQSAFPSKCRR